MLTPNLTIGPFQKSVELDFQHGAYALISNHIHEAQIKNVKSPKMEVIHLLQMTTPTLTLEPNQKFVSSNFEHGDPTLDLTADNVSKIEFWKFLIPRISQIFVMLTPNLTLGPF